ncbi:MAG: CoA transferase [Gammaproteobacteria bacterium]|nr:CoA transferase [Gammaproteobacteria bacterium]
MILDGIRVLDFTQYLAGPSATRLMAEMGAEIIKIEQAPGGDPGRLLPLIRDGRSGFFVQQNRGKQSLCLDLKGDAACAIIRELVPKVDIVIENFGPGVMEKRGFDYPRLKALNPRLIMASVSAFGRKSTLSHKTGYDWIAQAFSGLMHMTGPRDGSPHPVGIGVCDSNAGVHGFAALGYALYHRAQTGEGQYLDLSMVDAMFHMHEYNVHGRSVAGPSFDPKRMGAHHEMIAPFGVFKGPTGYFVIAVLQLQWAGMCQALGRPELERDSRFVDGGSRAKHQDLLIEMIEAWAATFSNNDAVLAALEAARVPAGPVLSPLDTLEHEYFLDRGMVRTVTDPILGEIQIPGFPFKFSAQPDLPEFDAPLLGEHNAAVLSRLLGYDAERIAKLEREQVIISARV